MQPGRWTRGTPPFPSLLPLPVHTRAHRPLPPPALAACAPLSPPYTHTHMWTPSSRPASSRQPVPGTIRQVRGATYPPLTAPPPRTNSSGGLSASCGPASLLSRSPAPTPPNAGGSSATPADSTPAPASVRRTASSSGGAPASAQGSQSTPMASHGAATPMSIPSTPMSLEVQRLRKFELLLAAELVDLNALRAAAWSGVPHQCRAMTWQLLLGYLPPNRAWRESTLERKRRE